MSSWLNEATRAFRSPAPYVSWAAVTSLLTVSGSFVASDSVGLALRFAYFGILVAVALAWGVLARIYVQWRWPQLTYWGASLVVIATSAVVLTWPLHALAHLLFRSHFAQQDAPGRTAFLIFTFGLCAAAIRWALSVEDNEAPPSARKTDSPPPPVAAAETARVPRILSRLDPALRGSLIRVSGRNHHVEVVTDKGAQRLLLRLSDALAELEGVEGIQVHRSHWVALGAIAGHERQSEKLQLVLSDGTRVPVSRAQRPEVERRGLI